MNYLQAPFPYFGGKASIAAQVWTALGQPQHYIEPFFGSGAVLLARPDYDPMKHSETICDADGHIANVWRSIQYSPEETANWCDWPVNHIDLAARRKVIIQNEDRLVENLADNDTWHDPKLAGYWIWAASSWIGSGLTAKTKTNGLGQLPHLGNTGMGVHKVSLGQRPHLSNAGKGVHKIAAINALYDWFEVLSNRLRRVRVVCGDWSRVCGGDWQDKEGEAGIFFDPPYSTKAGRANGLYNKDCLQVAEAVNAWCIDRVKRGGKYSIVLAGYHEEHENLLSHGWSVIRWKAHGGYAAADNQNRNKEALFLSPQCIQENNGMLL